MKRINYLQTYNVQRVKRCAPIKISGGACLAVTELYKRSSYPDLVTSSIDIRGRVRQRSMLPLRTVNNTMLQLVRISLAFIILTSTYVTSLTTPEPYVNGNKVRVIHVISKHTSNGSGSLSCCGARGTDCTCNSLDQVLANLTSNVLINITTNVVLSSLADAEVLDLENVTIIGHNKPVVKCNGVAVGIHLMSCTNCVIQDITWDGCGNHAGLKLKHCSNITIKNCSFQNSIGQAIVLSKVSGDVNISHCSFINNTHYRGHGAAIHYSSEVYTRNSSTVVFTIHNCSFAYNKLAKSLVYVKNRNPEHGNTIILNCLKFYHNQDASSVYAINQNLLLHGKVLFQNNRAKYGTGIYISDRSTVTFGKNSDVAFIQNFANYSGAAIFLINNSSIVFDENSKVTFSANNATNGTIHSEANSNVTFTASCQVSFNNNLATQSGSAICSIDNSHITFTGYSNITFGVNGYMKFKRNSTTASSGGAVFSSSSYITFKENSIVVFNNNGAKLGGAIHTHNNGHISFEDNSVTMFNGNTADHGGAIYTLENGHISFTGSSTTVFSNNIAVEGGTIRATNHGHILFKDNSTTAFRNNSADHYGGAIYTHNDGHISFEDNSTTVLRYNRANYGGGIYALNNGYVTFEGNSTTTFYNNIANSYGGAIRTFNNGRISFKDNINYTEFTNVTFISNRATYGGAMSANKKSSTTFRGHVIVTFFNNTAIKDGGAGYFNSHCIVVLNDDVNVTFEENNAQFGGAIHLEDNSNITFNKNSTAVFKDNVASNDGGAICNVFNSLIMIMDYVTLEFNSNNARYGGAIFFDATHSTLMFTHHRGSIDFINNVARITGKHMYFDVSILCNSSCLNNRVVDIDDKNKCYIATPPSKLELYGPTICIDNDNKTQCDAYFLNHVMLGEEIYIPVCVFDYFYQHANAARFFLYGESSQNYSISGLHQVSLSCNSFQGISSKIIGNNSLSKPINYSISINLIDDRKSGWKEISVSLTVGLKPCNPGFWQYPKSEKCECFNASDIVMCSGSSSTIKRGYWFGNVTGKPTVALCPVNYCSFTCCSSSNQYFHLSPLRNKQCRSHRSGTVCGNCDKGYTLPFYSPECINTDNCTVLHMTLVITLTILYWITLVVTVFIAMYYKPVNIGYLYGITYYYSIVDVLLSEYLYISDGLYITINIMYSIVKLTPQFLGKLCLVSGLSGIDQQFIHYIHPLAVSLMLVMIVVLARFSHRLSAFISRGIIQVICFLILLSYTSTTTTSLLLVKKMTFFDVEKIYTYLSPDIEYFHGRHLAYGTIALLCIIIIAIGLPLVLVIEPFLNKKISFAKIKPLLDQFQGCYRDKYRWFAAYYMICRLTIITITIVFSSDYSISRYLLITTCAAIVLIHLTVRPYACNILNAFDGILLMLLVLVAILLLVEFINPNSVIQITFVLLVLPLVIFSALYLFIHRDAIKRIFNRLMNQQKTGNMNNTNCTKPVAVASNTDIGLTIDDSMRVNATICIP